MAGSEKMHLQYMFLDVWESSETPCRYTCDATRLGGYRDVPKSVRKIIDRGRNREER